MSDEPVAGLVPPDSPRAPHSMKPLLGVAVTEAVVWALTDSVFVPADDGDRVPTDEERAAWLLDPYAIPGEALARMDVMALAQNVALRLMGPGGWYVNGVYSGNASAAAVLGACVARPDKDPLGDIKADLAEAGFGPDTWVVPDDDHT
jgi:hypothetical protein